MKAKLLMLLVYAAAALAATASPTTAQVPPQEPSGIPKLRGYFTVRKPLHSIDADTVRQGGGGYPPPFGPSMFSRREMVRPMRPMRA